MKYLLLSVMIVTIFSCASPRVVTAEMNDNVDFKSYKTYGFYATSDSMSQRLSAGMEVAKLSVANELNKRGLQQAGNNADLLINIGMVVNEEVDTRQTNFQQDAPRYLGQRRYSWKSEEVETGRYNVGTISIHLVESKENKMVWKGVVESVVPKRDEKIKLAIQQGIEKLFTGLPNAN